jgi:hypothetical protein
MQFKYEVKNLPEGFSGHVMLEAPLAPKRMRYIKELNFHAVDGKVDVGIGDVDKIARMIEIAGDHVKEVQIKSDKMEIKTFDELQCYKDFDSAIVDIASAVIGGMSLSKN